MKKLLLFSSIFIIFSLAGSLYGQTNFYTVSDIVIDKISQEALFYANVGLLNAQGSPAKPCLYNSPQSIIFE
ncbi:MAG: hypothetical protein LBE13_00760 [Bacteroidales bacterium]|nr:hypothetical protein [Bacteroidales bacterium]